MPVPTPQQLAHCLAQVTRFIPKPTPPRVSTQDSKWGLKVGQLLGSPAGEVFKVVETTSAGITLETPDGKVCQVTDKDELAHYSKLRKPRKPKAPKDKLL